ncbi:MAG: mannose-1-phosphate guanylyltransferase [Flavobacteriales bacterium]|jgi:mannose-1-phosphate guanylyltransferase|nr:mannose-1-phosphate guanylyltransferase [Flavobacteriales bacterium]
MNKKNYCVIMAGGIGSRFWPMSRTAFPKQFHDILGVGRTLLQMTYDRFLPVCPTENILVVTNERYKSLVLEQLPGLKPEQVLCEPYMRNTAPCVAYAAFWIAEREPDANIIVAPSDHLILKDDEFRNIIDISIRQAKASGHLVTLGIKPTRPDTGYGYIQWADVKNDIDEKVKKVKTFTEKPDLELAKDFLDSGDFYWNSGIFIWTLNSILNAFELYLPEMFRSFSEGQGVYGTDGEKAFINAIYPACDNISIDYGIMEKAKNVNVVLSDFGWSDLGTWGSLHTHLAHDSHQNGIVGKNVVLYNCADNVVNIPNDKLAVLHGLNGYIVVDTENILLVCKKEDEQKIKQFVNDVKISKGESWT